MIVKFFAPRWGFEHIPWETYLQSVKAAGYAGIEWFPFGEDANETDHARVVSLLEQAGLQFGIVMAVLTHYPDQEEYLVELDRQLRYFCSLRSGANKPLFISAQTGREFYNEAQVLQILSICRNISDSTGVPIYQETHRNKWSFAAHSVAPLLHKLKDLYLTLDISHWFCVSESYLHDQQQTVEMAIKQTRHVHARVGHTEGPQVYDPALPEYAEALSEHLKVWDGYIRERKRSGATYCTITPEFGPPPYMVFANRAGSAHEEQWRINLWMKELLEQRFTHIE